VKSTVLAKRYAKALFAVAKEEGALDEYGQALHEMATLFASVPEFKDALTNPVYPEDTRVKVMESVSAKMQVPPVAARFFKLLVEKKRAEALPEIAEVYQDLVDADRNLVRGVLSAASELPGDLTEKVKATLEKITGKQVVLDTRVDPALIGGIVAQVGDLVLDGSIRSQLAGLKESIKGSE